MNFDYKIPQEDQEIFEKFIEIFDSQYGDPENDASALSMMINTLLSIIAGIDDAPTRNSILDDVADSINFVRNMAAFEHGDDDKIVN